MFYRTYITFSGRNTYLSRDNDPDFLSLCCPLGNLVFGTMDIDWSLYLKQVRQLQDRIGAFPVSVGSVEDSLAKPESCAYYLVAELYHRLMETVKGICPGLFYLLDDTCLLAWRSYREQSIHAERALREYNQKAFEMAEDSDEVMPPDPRLTSEYVHLCDQMICAELLAAYFRSFPNIPDNLRVFMQKGTPDAGLADAAAFALRLLAEQLAELASLQEGLSDMIDFALCSHENKPRKSPAELLLKMQDEEYTPYCRSVQLQDRIHIKTSRYLPAGKRKSGGLAAATFYASDSVSSLIFLEFEQVCMENMLVLHCYNCGRLFAPYSSSAKYCQRIADIQTGATCKEIAAKSKYEASIKANAAKELIRKRKNTCRMRCSRMDTTSPIAMRPYYAFLDLANAALAEYEAGNITYEELELRTRLSK